MIISRSILEIISILSCLSNACRVIPNTSLISLFLGASFFIRFRLQVVRAKTFMLNPSRFQAQILRLDPAESPYELQLFEPLLQFFQFIFLTYKQLLLL